MLIVDVEDVLHPMTSLLSEPDSAILCLIIKASISPDGPEGKDALLFSALRLLLSCTTRSFLPSKRFLIPLSISRLTICYLVAFYLIFDFGPSQVWSWLCSFRLSRSRHHVFCDLLNSQPPEPKCSSIGTPDSDESFAHL